MFRRGVQMENKQKTRLDVLVEFTGIEKDKFYTRGSSLPKGNNELDENWTEFILENAKGKFPSDEYYDVLASEEEVEERLRSLIHNTTDQEELVERFGSDEYDDVDVSGEGLETYLTFKGELHGFKIYSNK
jgi:hypothetical protein